MSNPFWSRLKQHGTNNAEFGTPDGKGQVTARSPKVTFSETFSDPHASYKYELLAFRNQPWEFRPVQESDAQKGRCQPT